MRSPSKLQIGSSSWAWKVGSGMFHLYSLKGKFPIIFVRMFCLLSRSGGARSRNTFENLW
jgi:hypothetical protein